MNVRGAGWPGRCDVPDTMTSTTATSTSCPFLKRVVMLYCDACPMKKMVALDQLVSEGPCLAASFEDCAFYRDAAGRSWFTSDSTEPAETPAGLR